MKDQINGYVCTDITRLHSPVEGIVTEGIMEFKYLRNILARVGWYA
jgi:hypothetical protein